jgi:hypothetical protein
LQTTKLHEIGVFKHFFKLKESKVAFGFRQTPQNVFILFYCVITTRFGQLTIIKSSLQYPEQSAT